ncbi:MAG: BatA domain-containing protein, partial [Planctomycetota bacterium]|nr:BatA domain-containing protein [Planctomycetota bacterium]
MSLLFPLFLAGLGALGLPLLFHLVRRTPRGRQEFSSLMFLAPTPPRLTRRSRLDQILLLLLRLAALALLTLAFARPFLRESASLALTDLPGRRVAILIDTSASMRRAGLWQQAVQAAGRELDSLNPQDDVALYTFDDRLRTILGFDENGPVPGKPDLIRQRLKELSPTWGGTDLGGALTSVAADLDASGDVQQTPLEPQIVLIGDLQKGSRLDSLESFEWPQRVKVVLRQLQPAATTNAYAHILVDESAAPAEAVRVRVVNSANAKTE